MSVEKAEGVMDQRDGWQRAFDELIADRRTVRRYRPDPIAPEVYEQLLAAAIQAPSACNRQEWKFVVVNEPRLLHWLFERGGASFLDHVQQGILVLYCNRSDNLSYWDPVQSAAAAITLLQLKAWTMGIGSCWVCHLPPKGEMRRKFHIPSSYDPIAFVTLGYYQRKPFRKARKAEARSMIAYNRFQFSESLPRIDWPLLARRWARRCYYLFPWRHLLFPIVKRYEKKFYE